MKDWYQYLDKDFAKAKEAIRTRDRVVTKCQECGYRSVMNVFNLLKQIKRIGTHLCWSCSSRKAALKARPRYKNTLREKYGTDNPMRVTKFKEKALRTKRSRA